ncbi:NAD(P)-binding protein [Nocardia cyriacigeorgica]|uniref:NAD(P)-binding protein n=2 Tax=Nocardia cyriacigeorgica TaxID=135487 RepID=UPI001893685C|nr:NAD(P)-binding protein [Nocardia cyriacigeorgica]MBF6318464.1 NAD(P)-binding protein [Nocardia cyriacigeorgica]
MQRTAIVVGGGMSGLATAIGLTGVGWAVTLFEQAPALRAATRDDLVAERPPGFGLARAGLTVASKGLVQGGAGVPETVGSLVDAHPHRGIGEPVRRSCSPRPCPQPRCGSDVESPLRRTMAMP